MTTVSDKEFKKTWEIINMKADKSRANLGLARNLPA